MFSPIGGSQLAGFRCYEAVVLHTTPAELVRNGSANWDANPRCVRRTEKGIILPAGHNGVATRNRRITSYFSSGSDHAIRPAYRLRRLNARCDSRNPCTAAEWEPIRRVPHVLVPPFRAQSALLVSPRRNAAIAYFWRSAKSRPIVRRFVRDVSRTALDKAKPKRKILCFMGLRDRQALFQLPRCTSADALGRRHRWDMDKNSEP